MKELSVIILSCIALICSAQVKTNKVKWVYNNVDLDRIAENSDVETVYDDKGNVVSSFKLTEYLKFKGIPINGTKENFARKLLSKGFYGSKNWEDKEVDFKSKGLTSRIYLYSLCRPSFNMYEYDSNSDEMNVVTQEYIVWRKKETNIDSRAFLMNLRKDVVRNYNIISREDFCDYDDYFEPSALSLYTVTDKSRSKVIGEIIVGLYHNIDSHVFFVQYYSFANKNTFVQNGLVKWVDYSKYFPKFDEIYFADDYNYVRCYFKYNGIPYSYLFDSEDKDIILYVLGNLKKPYSKELMYVLLNDIMYEWLDKHTLISYNNLENTYNRFMTAINEQEERQKKEQRSFGFMDLLHMLAPGFFTKDDVELWNKLPEKDRKAIIQGSVGAYSRMGDTRSQTELMHTPGYSGEIK